MARVFESVTEAECVEVRNLGSKLLGYPTPGIHTGKGRHVVLGEAPGPGETKPGWTSFDVGITPVWDNDPQDPENPGTPDRYSIEVDAYEAEIANEDAKPTEQKRLRSSERTTLVTHLAQAQTRATILNEVKARV